MSSDFFNLISIKYQRIDCTIVISQTTQSICQLVIVADAVDASLYRDVFRIIGEEPYIPHLRRPTGRENFVLTLVNNKLSTNMF